ncbi:MAG: recombinase family protein [Hyphomicrobiaceae bacterium]
MKCKAKQAKELAKAVAYLRTSSATNVGADKDSEKRQGEAISRFAKHAHFEVVDTFYDEAVSGADAIETRPGFMALLDRIEGNGVRTVIVEDASRFARELMTQELGIMLLISRNVTVFAANSDKLTETDDPMKKALRQIAGVFAELEKSRLVGKLKSARDRKSEATGKRIEGRKAIHQTHPDAVLLAKRLRRANPKTGGRPSLREISKALEDAGYTNERGQPFAATSVKNMVEGPRPIQKGNK